MKLPISWRNQRRRTYPCTASQARLEQAEVREREHCKARSKAAATSEAANKMQAELTSSRAALHAALDKNEQLTHSLADAHSNIKVQQPSRGLSMPMLCWAAAGMILPLPTCN